jgi:hypothetical protein
MQEIGEPFDALVSLIIIDLKKPHKRLAENEGYLSLRHMVSRANLLIDAQWVVGARNNARERNI